MGHPVPADFQPEFLYRAHRQITMTDYWLSASTGWEAWLDFFLTGVQVQAQDDNHRDCMNDLRQAISPEVRSERMVRLVDLLFKADCKHPSVEAASDPIPTALRQVEKLVKAGYSGSDCRSRNRFYQADEILKVIGAPVAELRNRE